MFEGRARGEVLLHAACDSCLTKAFHNRLQEYWKNLRIQSQSVLAREAHEGKDFPGGGRAKRINEVLTIGSAMEAGGLPSIGGCASTWLTTRPAPSIIRFTVWCRTAAYRRSISTCAIWSHLHTLKQ